MTETPGSSVERRTTVHMIGQAHLDPAWLWRWTEGRAEALATSQSAADRLAEYPDFQYVRGEAQVYEWIESENPALFEQIKAYIRQGRWHVVNGMIIQPDMNLPQGESFVRHFLLAKRYMREHLGADPKVAYCVDSFGHAATLPMVFAGCGCDAYVFMRPGPHEMASLPDVFWWQAPDGSRVLTFRVVGSYGTRFTDLRAHIQRAVERAPDGLDQAMCFFGVGNHGGGPTREQIEHLHIVQGENTSLDIRFSSPGAYFGAIRGQAEGLPTVAEELYFHAVGCYSANSQLKRAHRQAENGLLLAERLTVMADVSLGWKAPSRGLPALWHRLCFNQFHDILGGCTIKEAADDAIMSFGTVTTEALDIADGAGRAIASQIDTRGPGGTVVVFNPMGAAQAPYVEYEPWTEWQPWNDAGWSLVDADTGTPILTQLVATREALSNDASHGITRLLFRAELPALGYRVYRFAPGLPRAQADSQVICQGTSLQSERLSVTLDAGSGAIVSCIDRGSGLELAGPGGWNVVQVLEDRSDTWSHRVTRYDNVLGQFGSLRVIYRESGPLQGSLLIEREYEGNTLLQQIVLRRDEPEILIRNWLTWHGQWRVLKLACDVAVATPRAFHDIPFGWLERPCDGSERATQMWLDVSGPASAGGTLGLGLLNDGKYGCDVSGSTLRLTLLRCPPYAYHEPPHIFGSKQRYDWLDQGLQEFTVVLRPHADSWEEAGIVDRARSLNMPPFLVTEHAHTGGRPRVASWGRLTSPDMELTALKPAENGAGYIVRVADRYGRGSQGYLEWQGAQFPISLSPAAVATFRIVSGGESGWKVVANNMIEE